MARTAAVLFVKFCFITTAVMLLVLVGITIYLALNKQAIKADASATLTALVGAQVEIDALAFEARLSGVYIRADGVKVTNTTNTTNITDVDDKAEHYQIAKVDSIFAKVDLINTLLHMTPQFVHTRISGADIHFSHNDQGQLLSTVGAAVVLSSQDLPQNTSVVVTDSVVHFDKAYAINNLRLSFDDGSITLSADQQILPLSVWFSHNDMPPFDIDVVLVVNNEAVMLQQLRAVNQDIVINGGGKLAYGQQKSLAFNVAITELQWADMARYLPDKIMDDDLHAWLIQALEQGSARGAQLGLQANNQQTWQQLLDNITLSARIPFNNTNFLFSTDWPPLKHAQGMVNIDNTLLSAQISGTLDELNLNNANVTIADLMADLPSVNINGSFANIDAEAMLSLFHASKMLEADIGQHLHNLSIQGSGNTAVDISVPLSDADTSAVAIKVAAQFAGNNLTIKDVPLAITNINAELNYVSDTFTASGRADVLDDGADFVLTKQVGKALEINVHQNDLILDLVQETDKWQVVFKHPGIYGKLSIPDNAERAWQADIDHLNINILLAASPTKTFDIKPSDIPVINGQIDKLIYHVEDLGKVIFAVNKQNTDKLNFKGNISHQKFKALLMGEWQEGMTTATFSVNANELKVLFDGLSIDVNTTGGELDADAELSCACNPNEVDVSNITGYVNADIKAGAFVDGENFFGKILSLLNFKALSQRLQLDLSDVLGEGFSYESISSTFNINAGRATVKHFDLQSSSSNIHLSGYSDLVKQAYHHRAKVFPNIADSVPLLAYLGGAGLIGLGVWAVDELLFDGKAFSQTLDFTYKISGPWHDPKIE